MSSHVPRPLRARQTSLRGLLMGMLLLSGAFACAIYSWNGSISSPGLQSPRGLILWPYAVMLACTGIGAIVGRSFAGLLVGNAIILLYAIAACVYLFTLN